jgi:hypothetical protein
LALNTANVTTTIGNVYVSTGNTAVTFLTLCNYSAGNVIANVHVVPSGDSAANVNLVLSELEIAPNDTYQFYVGNEKLLLENDDSIQVNASGNTALSAVTSYFVGN